MNKWKAVSYFKTFYDWYEGDTMSRAAREFAEDPCSSVKRGNMVRAARNLLSAVTRLLILADMVDVHRLLKSLQVVSVCCVTSPAVASAGIEVTALLYFEEYGHYASHMLVFVFYRRQYFPHVSISCIQRTVLWLC